jgi:hypothetical protein
MRFSDQAQVILHAEAHMAEKLLELNPINDAHLMGYYQRLLAE